MSLICVFIDSQLTSKDIADSIDAEMDGDLQKAFMTIGMDGNHVSILFIINTTKLFIYVLTNASY